MACNCGAKYDNKVPCCCSQGSPLVCTTTTCADAQICNQTIESNCVIYTGPNIECSGVTTGMTVTQVMDIILDGVNLINCSYCWSMDNSLSSLFVDAEYVNSDGETVPLTIEPYTVAQVCGRSVNTYISTLVPVNLGRCSVCFPTTTTTTSIPNVRCTFLSVLGQPGDYRIERFWDNLTTDPLTSEPFTFVLYDFIVDGVDYSNAETLIISLSSDLVTGVGLDGGTYVMNINDWLNTVAPQGFVCHDDMKVIEHPQGSTYLIRIRRINNSGTLDYFYTSTYGFAYGEQANTYGTYQCLSHSISTTTTTTTTSSTTSTTSTTTTTTAMIPVLCRCYEANNLLGCEFEYTQCDGTVVPFIGRTGDIICAQVGSITQTVPCLAPGGYAFFTPLGTSCINDGDC
jgi:hypothetical protein